MLPFINPARAGEEAIDGALLRAVLGIGQQEDDVVVNAALREVGVERGAVPADYPVADTLDEILFKKVVGTPDMGNQTVNATLAKLHGEQIARGEADARTETTDEIVRRTLNIPKDVWARFNGPTPA